MNRRHLVTGVILALLLVSLLPGLAATAQPSAAPVDPHVWQILEEEGTARVMVVLKTQVDLSEAQFLRTKEEKGQYVYEQLTALAEQTQPALRAWLDGQGVAYRSYWIQNMLILEADAPLVRTLSQHADVGRIDYYYQPYLDVLPGVQKAPTPNAVEWNIDRVDADLAWSLGITGTGAIVGDLDTGVQWDHPALINAYRGNLGSGNFDHNYNWWDGLGGAQVPMDFSTSGHGTHTMGTILGDDGGANQIGMAPGARWIACPGDIQDGGDSRITAFDCFQFFLAPTDLAGQNPRPELAPHVINCSWTWPGNYRPIIQTLYAAGIFYVKSGGNTGPACGTATHPGQYPEVTATAAFAQGDTIASFSSRGPVVLDHKTVLKPDIAAPGVNVRSSIPGSNYGTLSGTSMSAPHTTGAVALVVSARPELAGQIDTIQYILKKSAEPKIDAACTPFVDHPNDVWGWGILNAYNAVSLTQNLPLGDLTGIVRDCCTWAPLAGAKLEMREVESGLLFVPHTSGADGRYLYPFLPASTYVITASLFDYLPTVITITTAGSVTTTRYIDMTPAPHWELSGHVWEGTTPLAATITFEEGPLVLHTDPATGVYSATMGEGNYWMHVSSAGHAPAERQVPLYGDRAEDFYLSPVDNYYLRDSDQHCQPAFNWIDATDGTPHALGNDAHEYFWLDGHTFTFYNNPYTVMFIGSNGLLTFGTYWDKWLTNVIPHPDAPNNGIYAFATNLNPDGGNQGMIYHKWVGNVLVVEYYQVQHYPNGNPETFEVLLDMDTGVITTQYLTVTDSSAAVVGVENQQGSEATQYGYGNPAAVHSGLAVSFYPAFGTPPAYAGAGTLSGVVTDASTSAPLPGATVNAVDNTGTPFTATTDMSGTYTMDLCTGSYTATASAAGYYPSLPQPVEVLSGTTTVQDFALQACVPVVGADFGWQPRAPVVDEPVLFTGEAWAGRQWVTETVGGGNPTGHFVSLVIDREGHPHIGYTSYVDYTLKYAHHNGLTWQIETVDNDAGGNVSLVLDSLDRPHLAYTGASADDLNYAYYNGSSWITMTAITAGFAGELPSLALDSSGFPHIAYSVFDESNDSDLQYASYNGTSWLTETVDSTGSVGPFASLVIDSAGYPHISYADFTRSVLNYAYYNGTDWITETVDSQGRPWGNTSIALDAADHPEICYDYAIDAIKCAHYDGVSWQSEVVDQGAYPSLAMDAAGSLHLGYLDDVFTGRIQYAYYDGSAWVTEMADSRYSDWGAVSLALDPLGHPHIISPDLATGGVRYTHREYMAPTLPAFTWSFGDGATATGITATHAYAASGQYLVTMTATNDCTAVPVVVTHTVEVCAPVQGLIVGWTPLTPVAGQAVTLTASAGGDEPISYTWDLGDGTPPFTGGQGGVVTHTYTLVGDYTVTVTATNACGQEIVSAVVSVVAGCDPVSGLDATWAPIDPTAGQDVTFSASASGSAPIDYSWNFGDGGSGTGITATHAFATAGVYSVTVTATNGCGTDAFSFAVTVRPGMYTVYLPIVFKTSTR